MNIEYTNIKINILKNIGELSEQRIEILKKLLKDDFSQNQIIPGGVVFMNPNKKNSIIVTNNQITFAQDEHDLKPNYYEAKNFIKMILDKFMMGYKNCRNTIELSGVIKLENSNHMIGKKIGIEKLGDLALYGVGLRYIIRDSKLNGEYRFEPFIQNNNYLFSSLVVEMPTADTIDSIILDVENVIEPTLKNITNESYYKFIEK